MHTAALIKLAVVFAFIMSLLWVKVPMYTAIAAGIAAVLLLYGVAPAAWGETFLAVALDSTTLSVLFSLYLFNLLQRILEARGAIAMAQADLNGAFHNRRINTAGAPLFMGLLPSAAAMLLCSNIVKDAVGDDLDPREMAFVASWFRHIPESAMPTYTGVLLMCSLSGVPLPKFVLGMLVPVLALIFLGYAFYLRKLPKEPDTPVSTHRLQDALNLLRHLWALPVVLLLIIAVGIRVDIAAALVIAACLLVYRIRPRAFAGMAVSAFEWKLLLNTFLVLLLKEFLARTGVLLLLPDVLARLPLPPYLIFALFFFLGGLISGTNGIVALGIPIVFGAMPDAGLPIVVLLMCMCHMASQLTPTHICLVVAADAFNVSFGDMIKKTLPVAACFALLMVGYYHILQILV